MRRLLKRDVTTLTSVGFALVATLACVSAVSAQGKGAPARSDRAAVLAGLVDCRKVSDPTARLACYDKATDELDRAEKTGEVTVIDRAQAKTIRRQAFGFDLPSINLFSRGAAAAGPDAPKEEAVDRVTATLDHAGPGRDGRWRMVTEEGAVWVQIDDEMPARDPHKGSQLAVRRAALGSYFCNVDGQRAMRCQRQH